MKKKVLTKIYNGKKVIFRYRIKSLFLYKKGYKSFEIDW